MPLSRTAVIAKSPPLRISRTHISTAIYITVLVSALFPSQLSPNLPQPLNPQQDYETRLAKAIASGRQPPTHNYLRWLHIPKTGTSFANTLIRWGCTNLSAGTIVRPRKEVPEALVLPDGPNLSWDWLFTNKSGRDWMLHHCNHRLVTHRSGRYYFSFMVHKAIESWERTYTASFFRLPLQRTFSNYEHLSRHYNASRAPSMSLEQFLNRSEFWSQQTKMVLGYSYKVTDVLSKADAYEAAEIVRSQLGFVGLTEHFQLSIRLFHAKFGGVPHRNQFINVRPGISRHAAPHALASDFRYDETVFADWRDVPDDILYEAARRRFWSDVRQFKHQIELDALGPVDIVPARAVDL